MMVKLTARETPKLPDFMEEGRMYFDNVLLMMCVVNAFYKDKPWPNYMDVHTLVEAFERMFPRQLEAKHGFTYHVGVYKDRTSFPSDMHKVRMYFPTRSREIAPKDGRLQAFPHSWLLHTASGTIIDVLYPGAYPGQALPVWRPPHHFRPPYNDLLPGEGNYELIKKKLPEDEKVSKLHKELEKLASDESFDVTKMMFMR